MRYFYKKKGGDMERGVFNQKAVSVLGCLVMTLMMSTVAQAGDSQTYYFRNLRSDLTVPEHCRQTELTHFRADQIEFFTMGASGARERGFDQEYPVERDDARILWYAFKKDLHEDEGYMGKIRRSQVLSRDYDILMNNFEEMGFDFTNEGEVLELLAIVAMEQNLPEDRFVYGSVFYQDRVAGELDLMIARADTCAVEAVGEAKLGRALGKARRQLARFRNFLHSHSVQKVLSDTGLSFEDISY